MTNYNEKNERIKRDYFRCLREARRQSVSTVDAAAKAIDRFETYTRYRDFARFHIEQATGFKRHLAQQVNARTRKPISAGTQLHTLSVLREFFAWLADQPGYRSRIRYSDAEYFGFPRKETAVARMAQEPKGPTVEQVRHVLSTMLAETPIELRNRAVVAFVLLTGARDNAVASLRMKHVDLPNGSVVQDPREVRTKASKAITTFFFPVGNDVRTIVENWIAFLARDKLWGPDDPLFPATRVAVGANMRFEACDLDRKAWSTASPIREIFRNAFEAAALPYFNPHSLRNTLARLGVEMCRTPQELWIWSQNLGHEHLMTTLGSYGHLDERTRGQTMQSLWNSKAGDAATSMRVNEAERAMVESFLEAVRKSKRAA